jgi:DNA-binding transcriptional LysR family regulator
MDIPRDFLRSFIVLCEHKSFTQAAKELSKSQSTLSIQVAEVENQLELKLLDRAERPLRLTEAGTAVLAFAKEMNNRREELQRFLRELASGNAGEVKIGASTSIGTYLFPQIASTILSKAPQLNLEVIIQGRTLVCESVRRAEVNFGLILTERTPEGLLGQSLKTEFLCFVSSPKHPLAGKKRISLEQLSLVPFVAGPKSSEFAIMVERSLEARGLYNYPVRLRISNYEGIKEAIRANIGIGMLPKFTVEREVKEKILTILDINYSPFLVNLMLIERPGSSLTPTIRALKNHIEMYLKNH